MKLGPRFIFSDPHTAAKRRATELATLKRKIQKRFYDRKVSPGRPVDQFIAELDILLQKLHSQPAPLRQQQRQNKTNVSSTVLSFPSELFISSQMNRCRTEKKQKTNYSRAVKRLKHKLTVKKVILQKTDKSKVFHLGKLDDYRLKSKEYMDKTQAYQCLGDMNPLPALLERTNKYLLDLRLAKWISQKQYELLCVKPEDAELAHLYYLPKTHKPGTPLRPIISGLRHPTINISKFLDNLLRPLFDRMAQATTIESGFELVKRLEQWCPNNLKEETLFCTIDVADLYTMIPQVEGVLSFRKMFEHLKLNQIEGLKTETIIRLSRFVMKNNYFSFDGQFYHQIRGGAMGSPLTLTMANCYMFFFERQIARQVINSGGLYVRYIDDLFITINWPERHLLNQINRWNEIDQNIKLKANVGQSMDFLDLHIEYSNSTVHTRVFHKPSYEPYYLPFNSVHPIHIKKNIPFVMYLRAIRYCSSFQSFIEEREALRMSLLLNKYPNAFIQEQFESVLKKANVSHTVSAQNYSTVRSQITQTQFSKEKTTIDHESHLFIHFTYCCSMNKFPSQFRTLWHRYFDHSPIGDINPIVSTRNVDNLQRRLVHTRTLGQQEN